MRSIDQDRDILAHVVESLLAEIHPDAPPAPALPSSDLMVDLGLDSLDRVELLGRVEEAFGVTLPDGVLEAGTLAAWLAQIERAREGSHGKRGTRPAPEQARPPRPRPGQAASRPGTAGIGPAGRSLTAASRPGTAGIGPAGRSLRESADAGASRAAPQAGEVETLLDVMAWHAREHPHRRHLRLLDMDSGEGESDNRDVTYGALLSEALEVARSLERQGMRPGDAVGLMLPTMPSFFPIFAGILAAGGIAVPIYPPARRDQLEAHLLRQARILDNAQVTILVTIGEARLLARVLRLHVPTLRRVVDAKDLVTWHGHASRGNRGRAGGPVMSGDIEAAAAQVDLQVAPPKASDLAMLQYTSGSTGSPKGVMLTHRHLLANLQAMGDAAHPGPEDTFVSWLPLYHDMGLIGVWMACMYHGFPSVIMSPLAFLSRPVRWLRAIASEGGTISAAPNFAYDLCAARISDEDLAGIDLSSWRIAMNGAEPVRAETIERFSKRFSRYGFDPRAMAPVYGMAEVGLGLTFTPPGRGPLIDAIDRAAFEVGGHALSRPLPGEEAKLQVVSCGSPLPGFEIRIVDNASGRGVLPDRREGRVQCRGPSTTPGYYRNPEATRALYDGPWLDTGDLGYLADGELYLTGRAKDLIIRAGRNYHPEEIEMAIGQIPGIRNGCVAAFALSGSRQRAPDRETPDRETSDRGTGGFSRGTEELVVVAESRVTDPGKREAIRRTLIEKIVEAIGSPPDRVVLAPPGSVLKTSSGKIRRSATRERYEAGLMVEGGTARKRSAATQVLALVASGVMAATSRFGDRLGELLWAAYAWVAVLAIGIPSWLVIMLLPGRRLRWKAVRAGGAMLCAALGIELTLREVTSEDAGGAPLVDRERAQRARAVGSIPGKETARQMGAPFLPGGRVPGGRVPGGSVIVANHASFVDSLALLMALPGPLTFTAGSVLESQRVAGPFLRRIGAAFVGSGDSRRAEKEMADLIRQARSGETVVFFPEGGLSRTPGVGRFHLGAFVVASSAGVPVVPVGIRGTRGIVAPGSRFPRKGRVEVLIGPAIVPRSPDVRGEPGSQGAAVAKLRPGDRTSGPRDSRWSAAAAIESEARRSVIELAGEGERD